MCLSAFRYEFGKSESAVVTTVYHWHAHAVADLHFTTDGNLFKLVSLYDCVLVLSLPLCENTNTFGL